MFEAFSAVLLVAGSVFCVLFLKQRNTLKKLEQNKEIINSAKRTLTRELNSIKNLKSTFNNKFCDAVNIIYNTKGKIVITGVGKSGVIGMKIVATLNSTGTPSVFMHAGDAIHGDLGIIQKNDIKFNESTRKIYFHEDRLLFKYANVLKESQNIPSSFDDLMTDYTICLLYTSPSPRDRTRSRMPSSA